MCISQDVYVTRCVNDELLESVIRDCFPRLKVLLDGTFYVNFESFKENK